MSSPLCHFELMTKDPDKAKAFYGQVFGWQFDDQTMPGYTLISTGQDPHGGIMKQPESPAASNIYFKVADIEATLAKVKELGGKVTVPKSEIPGIGFFALFVDPEGIGIGLMQPAE